MKGVEPPITGGCHCGAIRYRLTESPINHTLCHCIDCRRASGAPMVGWAMFNASALLMEKGLPQIYASSEHARRHFCAACGTGLFYTNEKLVPGLVDVQSATFDEPDKVPAQMQIQTADRIAWMAHIHELPQSERYPGRFELD